MSLMSEEIVPAARGGRLASLDVFRGLTIAGMILVNNPGSWASVYPPLRHAEWDGWTPTDLVFPFFLFIVGVSIPFALSKRLDDPDGRRAVVFKIVRRSLIIFGLGIALAGFPSYRNLATIRIPGVLQRIALCYFAASMIFLTTRTRGRAIAAAALLAVSWLAMTRIPVPGFGPGDLARGHDLSSYLDRLLLAGHIYKPDYDPEGILSTIPAISTTLIGVLAGQWLRSGRSPHEIDAGLYFAGTVAVAIGWAWGGVFPINKALWTGSFVLLTAGLGMIGLATCYWLVDIRGCRRWSAPFRVFGCNAIAAYTLAAVLARLGTIPSFTAADGKLIGLQQLMYDQFFVAHLAPPDASLAFAATFLLACFLVILTLDAVGIHIRA